MDPTQLPFPAADAAEAFFHGDDFLRRLLPDYLPTQRWFTSKGKRITDCQCLYCFRFSPTVYLTVISVGFSDATRELYQLPLAFVGLTSEVAKTTQSENPDRILARAAAPNDDRLLIDAVALPDFRHDLFHAIRTEQNSPVGLKFDAGQRLRAEGTTVTSRVPPIDTSNTAIIYNDRFFFKLFRKLDPGLNPDLELIRYLSERAGYAHCPAYGGSFSVAATPDTDFINLGMMIGLVENRGDAWAYFQQLTERFYRHLIDSDLAASAPPRHEVVTDYEQFSGAIRNVLDRETFQRAHRLGKRTGEMHLALAAASANEPELCPEPFTLAYREEVYQAARRLLDRQFNELRYRAAELPPTVKATADSVLLLRELIEKRLAAVRRGQDGLSVTRIHADYHLGQVLVTEDDFVIIDFEGEPLLPIPERRRKRPPFKDLAGMVRSFHYAAMGQLLLNEDYTDTQRQELTNWGEWWFRQIRGAFLNGYMSVAEGADFVPDQHDKREDLLDFFVLEKAIYEVAYELNSRPKWLPIPLKGMLFALQDNAGR